MPTITATPLPDFPALGFAAGVNEEEGGNVLFAVLFRAVVTQKDTENIMSSPETPIAVLPKAGVGNCPLAEVLFSQFDEESKSSEGTIDALSEAVALPLVAEVGDVEAEVGDVEAEVGDAEKDIFEEQTLTEIPIGEEQKEEADAGVVAAIPLPVSAQASLTERSPSKNHRLLTIELITQVTEDLVSDYDVIDPKEAKQIKMRDDVPKIMAVRSDKMTELAQTARQQQRLTPDMFRADINIADEIEGAVEDTFDGLALKAIRITNQTAPAVPSVSFSGTGADTSLSAQASFGAQTQLSTGSDARGQFAGGAQGELRSSSAETWLEMLDTQDENWTEQLVKRVKRNLANAKEGIEFELNPRSLGKLRVKLSMQQNETQLQMRTETSQAAQLITDAQARLSAMLEDAGMKLSYLNTSSQNEGDSAKRGNSGNSRQNNQKDAQSNASDITTEQNNDATEASDSLVNVKA